jgi:hypothetical protein
MNENAGERDLSGLRIDRSTKRPPGQRRAGTWMYSVAAIVGLVGGFLPAVRASRMGIVDALRTA